MAGMKERLPELREETKELYERIVAKRGLDDPAYWAGYMSDHRLLAVAAYALDHDVQGFKEHMTHLADWYIKILERYKQTGNGESYYESSCSKIPDILALGSLEYIRKVVTYTEPLNVDDGGPDFAKYFHYAYRLLVLGRGATRKDLDDMEDVFKKKHKSFAGYAVCFQAIYDQDVAKFTEGFEQMMKDHKRICANRPLFISAENEVIAIWPLGIVNLARLKGLDVTVDHPLVPSDLLTPHLGGL